MSDTVETVFAFLLSVVIIGVPGVVILYLVLHIVGSSVEILGILWSNLKSNNSVSSLEDNAVRQTKRKEYRKASRHRLPVPNQEYAAYEEPLFDDFSMTVVKLDDTTQTSEFAGEIEETSDGYLAFTDESDDEYIVTKTLEEAIKKICEHHSISRE